MTMYPPNEVLRFKLKEVYHGFAECNGLLRLDDEYIHIEFVVKDSIVGFFKTDVKNIRLKYDRLIEAELINSFWKGRTLILRPKSMLDSNNFPVTDKGEIHFKLEKDKQLLMLAETIATFINLKVAESRINNLI